MGRSRITEMRIVTIEVRNIKSKEKQTLNEAPVIVM